MEKSKFVEQKWLETLTADKRAYCGLDEAGAGPLCGDVYAAAVILDPNQPIAGLNDSKKLSEKKRNALYKEICEKALDFAIATATVSEIDSINILQARLLAMKRAYLGLTHRVELALVDGNRLPNLPINAKAIIKGDGLVEAISAASILAKVSRDKSMYELDVIHPEYGFAKHKGYGTKQHMQALQEHGVTPYHRKSFAPVAKLCKPDLS